MQTAGIIYIVMWALFVVPLIGFNIKRFSSRKMGEKRKPKWFFLTFVFVLTIIVSVFLYSAYTYTVHSRYELAAERYIDTHAEYVTGQITYEEYLAKTAGIRTADADTSSLKDELALSDQTTPKSIKFQIGNWITPKYYTNSDLYPVTAAINDQNPVFLWYRLVDGNTTSIYLIEMVWNDAKGWQIAYHARATDEQAKSQDVLNALPSLINGKWYHISA